MPTPVTNFPAQYSSINYIKYNNIRIISNVITSFNSPPYPQPEKVQILEKSPVFPCCLWRPPKYCERNFRADPQGRSR